MGGPGNLFCFPLSGKKPHAHGFPHSCHRSDCVSADLFSYQECCKSLLFVDAPAPIRVCLSPAVVLDLFSKV